MFIFNMKNLIEIVIFIDMLVIFILLLVFFIINAKNLLINRKTITKRMKNQKIAIKIINEFENLLEEKNILIPNEERNHKEDEACIYGKDYYNLEDNIVNILNNNKGDL